MPRSPAKDKVFNKLYANGYVYNRDGRAYLNITVDGIRIREATPYNFTKENFSKLRELLGDRIEFHLKPVQERITVYELLEHYLKNKSITKGSHIAYVIAFKSYFSKDMLFDAKAIIKVVTKGNSKLKDQTLKGYLAKLQAVFNFAVDSNLIDKNPITKLMTPKVDKKEITLPTLKEIEAIAKKIEYKPFFYNLFFIMRWSGMRVAEAYNLTENNIKGDIIEIVGKGNVKRSIPYFPELKPYVENYIKVKKHPIGSYLTKLWSLGFNSHLLRKFRENELMLNNHNLFAVAQILGHTPATQNKHYLAMISNDKLKEEFL